MARRKPSLGGAFLQGDKKSPVAEEATPPSSPSDDSSPPSPPPGTFQELEDDGGISSDSDSSDDEVSASETESESDVSETEDANHQRLGGAVATTGGVRIGDREFEFADAHQAFIAAGLASPPRFPHPFSASPYSPSPYTDGDTPTPTPTPAFADAYEGVGSPTPPASAMGSTIGSTISGSGGIPTTPSVELTPASPVTPSSVSEAVSNAVSNAATSTAGGAAPLSAALASAGILSGKSNKEKSGSGRASPGFSIPRMKFRRSASSTAAVPLSSSPGSMTPGTPATPNSAIAEVPGTPGAEAKEKRKRFKRSWSTNNAQQAQIQHSQNSSGSVSSGENAASQGEERTGGRKERLERPLRRGKGKKASYSLGGGGNDIVGIVMLEIQGAEDLPRLKNSKFLLKKKPSIVCLLVLGPQ